MSRSIYDIFNDRKEGINVLYEGAEYEDVEVEAYESLEVAIDELEKIVKESTNEFIEFQAAAYLEDLVLENMMYEKFDEEKLQTTIEATMGEIVDSLVTKVKQQWEKIKAWFAAVAKSIVNFFTSGEKLVSENAGKIPGAMKNCSAKVKIFDYKDPDAAMNKCTAYVDRLKVKGLDVYTNSKQSMTKVVGGANDRSEIAGKIKALFGMEETKEKQVNAIDAKLAMKYAGEKKAILDNLNKQKKQYDNDFKEIISELEKAQADAEGKEKTKATKQVEALNFANSLKSAVINAEISCIKKGASDMAAVIRKALSASEGMGQRSEGKRRGKEADAQTKSFEKEAERQNGYEIESFKANLESMMEELEFIDED